MRVGVDAMGGDFAPEAVVFGVLAASERVSEGTTIVLFGDRTQIEELVAKSGKSVPHNIEIIHTSEAIGMGDHPTQAFSQKPDSSIVVGFNHLKEKKIDAFASAGSTGAMLVGCMYTIKQIEGVIRPTIAGVLPRINGKRILILDVGLNIDCKPEVLNQYGLIGSVYSKTMLGIENPRVALLNIGEEKEKGNIQTRATHTLMAESGDFNFVGNMEAKHIFSGEDVADVVVCDGFVGNTILKLSEGFADIYRNAVGRDSFADGLNYEYEGGTPVLGVNECVIIGHGCSTPLAIENMVIQTERNVKNQLVQKIKEAFC